MRLALSLILACLLVANVRGSEPSPANADSAEKELDALKMKLAAIMRAVDLIRATQEFNYHVDVQRRHPKLDDAALYKARDAMLKHGKAYMSGIRDLETPLYGDADLGRANFAAMEIFSETYYSEAAKPYLKDVGDQESTDQNKPTPQVPPEK